MEKNWRLLKRQVCLKLSSRQRWKTNLAFSGSQQQPVKSGNIILLPKIFGNLNFQLKNSNRIKLAIFARDCMVPSRFKENYGKGMLVVYAFNSISLSEADYV